METLLLSTLIPIGYFSGVLGFARYWFRTYEFDTKNTDSENAFFAFLTGVFWPFLLVVLSLGKAIKMPNRSERHAIKEKADKDTGAGSSAYVTGKVR
jgi:hypothetical protein